MQRHPALVSSKQTQGTGRGGERILLHAAKHPKCTAQRLGAQSWDQRMGICSLGLSGTQLGEVLGDYDTVFVLNIMLLLISDSKSTFKTPQKFNP